LLRHVKALSIAARKRNWAVAGFCLAFMLMSIANFRPSAIRPAGDHLHPQRLSVRSQASPDRRQFLTMMAHAPVAGAALAESGNGAAANTATLTQPDTLGSDAYPTIEHKV